MAGPRTVTPASGSRSNTSANTSDQKAALPEIEEAADLSICTLTQLKLLAEKHEVSMPAAASRKDAFRLMHEFFGFGQQPKNTPAPAAAAGSEGPFTAMLAALRAEMREERSEHSTRMSDFADGQKLMQAKLDEIQGLHRQVNSLQGENAALNRTVAELHEQVQSLQSSFEAVADAPDIERRKCSLRVSRLPPEVQTQDDAAPFVAKLLHSLDQPPAVEVKFMPASKASFANVAAGSSRTKQSGSILVECASFQDKLGVLKARSKLRGTDFHSVGVDENLTTRQQAARNACWDQYLQARREKKRTFWRGGQLFVDGELRPPTARASSPSPPSRTPTQTAPSFQHSNSFTPIAQE